MRAGKGWQAGENKCEGWEGQLQWWKHHQHHHHPSANELGSSNSNGSSSTTTTTTSFKSRIGDSSGSRASNYPAAATPPSLDIYLLYFKKMFLILIYIFSLN